MITQEQQSLSGRVYNLLIDRLHASELLPGQAINRRTVAREVGVSVAPVLEALVRLEQEGFVESFSRKGTRVRRITIEDVIGQFIVREALEVQGARLSCGEPIRQHEAELLALARQVDRTAADTTENWKLDLHFHHRLMELAACPALLANFDRVARLSLFHAANDLCPPPPRKINPHSHAELVKALQTENPDQAEQVMRRHFTARQTIFSGRR